MKQRKKEDLKYFGGKTWLAYLLDMPYFRHFALPDGKTIPVNLVLTIWLSVVESRQSSSQAVSHPSTIRAQCCLTSVIGRELVCSTWDGR